MWIIDSVIDHTISISRYNPLARRSYIKLPKELDHPRKGLTNIQITDDYDCFKWCLVRYLNPASHDPPRITKANKDFTQKPDFKDIKFAVKIRGISKIEKKSSIGVSVFSYKNNEKHSIYVLKKCCEEKNVDLFLIGEGKIRYALIKDSNTFMYDHSLCRGRKHFFRYCLYVFITEEIFKRHIKDCFKSNGKQRIIMPKKGEYIKFKHFERKVKSPIMISADFESIL